MAVAHSRVRLWTRRMCALAFFVLFLAIDGGLLFLHLFKNILMPSIAAVVVTALVGYSLVVVCRSVCWMCGLIFRKQEIAAGHQEE